MKCLRFCCTPCQHETWSATKVVVGCLICHKFYFLLVPLLDLFHANIYLGLPLSVTKPKRVDEQLLVDRIAGKLSPWRGKQMTKVARLVLTNSVLTAIATYFLTILTLSSWAIKKIDKIRRIFFGLLMKRQVGPNAWLPTWRRIATARLLPKCNSYCSADCTPIKSSRRGCQLQQHSGPNCSGLVGSPHLWPQERRPTSHHVPRLEHLE